MTRGENPPPPSGVATNLTAFRTPLEKLEYFNIIKNMLMGGLHSINNLFSQLYYQWNISAIFPLDNHITSNFTPLMFFKLESMKLINFLTVLR